MFLLIWIIYLGSVNAFSQNTSRLCFLDDGFVRLFCMNESSSELSCPDNHLIRINDIQLDSVAEINDSMYSCGRCPQNDEPGLLENVTELIYFRSILNVACARKNRCNFLSDDYKQIRADKHYIWTAHVMYNCVEKDLFKDICSSWIQETDYVHIFLNSTGSDTSNCSCTVEGDREDTNIEIVDYRPFKTHMFDYECADSLLIIDGKDTYQCTENWTDSSVYNTHINVMNNVTNIAVLFNGILPEMLWIHIKGKNMTVKCNYEDISSTFPSSFTTIDTISTDTLTLLPETEATKETNSTKSTITSPVLNGGNVHESFLSLPIIAGGSVGLLVLVIVIAVFICFLCRRNSNRTTKNKDKAIMYAEYNSRSEMANISTARNGIVNQGHETDNKIVHIATNNLSNSSYEEVGKKIKEADNNGVEDGTEYTEPADVVTDNIYALISEKEPSIQMLPEPQNNVEGHNYTEPYDKDLTIDTESQNNYAKMIKRRQKKDAYDTCCGNDSYSHILIGMSKQAPKTDGNYSHIQITGNKHDNSCFGHYENTKVRPWDKSKVHDCTGMYNNVKINTAQKDLIDREKELDNNSACLEEEEEEYDHLNKFSYHSVI